MDFEVSGIGSNKFFKALTILDLVNIEFVLGLDYSELIELKVEKESDVSESDILYFSRINGAVGVGDSV